MGETDIAREFLPTISEGFGPGEDLLAVSQIQLAAEIGAPEANASGDRDLLGGKLQEERTSPVG